MGAQNSILRSTLEDEKARLLKAHKSQPGSSLTLAHLMDLQLPASPFNLDPTHLGVLWMLDRSKKGLISTDDLLAMAKEGGERMRCYQVYEFQSQMQGFCMLQLHQSIFSEGEEKIVAWLMRVIAAAGRTTRFPVGGEELYIREDVARMLHTLFNMNEFHGLEFADFWIGLREAGFEAGLLDLEDQRQKSWVPLLIIEHMLVSLVAGIRKVMDEIFPMDETLS